MQPDAVGLAFATGVLAGSIGVFWVASRVISGPVAELSYTIGREIARGVAEWAGPRPAADDDQQGDAGRAGPDMGPGHEGDRGDGDDGPAGELVAPVLVRVVAGRPRLHIECRLRVYRGACAAMLRGTALPAGSAYGIRLTRARTAGTIAA